MVKPKKRGILITGVGSYWGEQVAKQILQNRESANSTDLHLIGVDSRPPKREIKGLDFIQADVRNPLFVDLLRSENIQTVCHLYFSEASHESESNFDQNVMGTLKLMGACAEAGVQKVILKSSTAVYGALPANPAYLTEKHPLQAQQVYASNRHLLEIEAFCNGFQRQVPEMKITILRFASVVGPEADTPMTRFLKEPLAPVLLGFDPLMQIIHERDVVQALVHVIANDFPGVFNVAAEGVLPLSRLTTLAAKIAVPVFHLFAYWGTGAMSAAGFSGGKFWPIEPDYLRYSWVADIEKMRVELGFQPVYTASQALREFAGKQRLRRFLPEALALAYDEERLRDTLERRNRVRASDG